MSSNPKLQCDDGTPNLVQQEIVSSTNDVLGYEKFAEDALSYLSAEMEATGMRNNEKEPSGTGLVKHERSQQTSKMAPREFYLLGDVSKHKPISIKVEVEDTEQGMAAEQPFSDMGTSGSGTQEIVRKNPAETTSRNYEDLQGKEIGIPPESETGEAHDLGTRSEAAHVLQNAISSPSGGSESEPEIDKSRLPSSPTLISAGSDSDSDNEPMPVERPKKQSSSSESDDSDSDNELISVKLAKNGPPSSELDDSDSDDDSASNHKSGKYAYPTDPDKSDSPSASTRQITKQKPATRSTSSDDSEDEADPPVTAVSPVKTLRRSGRIAELNARQRSEQTKKTPSELPGRATSTGKSVTKPRRNSRASKKITVDVNENNNNDPPNVETVPTKRPVGRPRKVNNARSTLRVALDRSAKKTSTSATTSQLPKPTPKKRENKCDEGENSKKARRKL